ncbi:MAG: glycoside hydrolase family 2 protein [Eubacteriales bacterium]|nr:glycoside hydrolase family 2 protein [Eubacteriales bacterium]
MKINNWFFSYEDKKGIECSVPCSLYSIMLDNNLMEDPFYGMNEWKANPMSERDCQFYTTLSITKDILNKENIILRFNGLDTLCDIYIGDRRIAKTDNMHRRYEFDIKPYLIEGDNTICVYIRSPSKYIAEMQHKHHLWNPSESMSGTSHIRKASYMFGWDWGPMLPDMGIWKDVEFLAFDGAILENALILQSHDEGRVTLDIKLELKGSDKDAVCKVSVDGQTVETKYNECKIVIDNPKLWWPNGLGEQNLYDVKFELYIKGEKVDEMTKTIGLRTLTISQDADKWGNEFCFKVNGEKVFSMGADYIPQDNILSRVTPELTEKRILDCVKANYNSIRVWGGGYYPEDEFFDLCDKYGLIVWQDFMFACVCIRMRDDFEATVKEEAIYNVKRIRHHASLGLLCGNNEMEEGVKNWDNMGESDLVRDDYIRLYENLLADISAKYAPQTFYWPSSPSSGGGFVNPNDDNRGDVHYWTVWHGNAPFEEYRNHFFRFCSEFGFESFPNIKTINSFCPDDQKNIFSKIMENHQKCRSGNGKILTYCAANYLYIKGFEDLVYASQLLQADAMKYAIEHFRRFRGRCMGGIYWQFNDCWPVASWASVDWYGRWKALHYSARRFFAPVLMSIHEEGKDVSVNISNETLTPKSGKVTVEVKDIYFNVYYTNTTQFSIKKMASKDIVMEELEEYLGGFEEDRYVVATYYDENDNEVSKQTLLFTKPKSFGFHKPDIKVTAKNKGNEVIFSITSDTYAKGVEIDFNETDLIFSDNYFDIASKEPIIIRAETDKSADELIEEITIKSVYNLR